MVRRVPHVSTSVAGPGLDAGAPLMVDVGDRTARGRTRYEGVNAPKNVDAPVQPGDILAGKYRVERVLGVGAMGVVVAALHVDLGERRALKFMLPSMLGNTEGVERFLRE